MVRLSSRLHWSSQQSSIARAVAQRHGTLLDLTHSNPTTAGFTYPAQRILKSLSDARALQYEPTPRGLTCARRAVAAYYSGSVYSEQIIMTASTSEAYSWLFKLLCDAGDQILVPRPSYPLFEYLANLETVQVIQYPMHYVDGWYIDYDALRNSVTERTRALVFVNPNNPTGSFLKRREYDLLVGLCRKHGLALISDEVFADYALGSDEARVQSVAGRDAVLTFALSGLSKVSALPQLKLGWIVASGPPSLREQAISGLELIADTFLSVGTPVQWAAPELLASRGELQKQICERAADNLAALRKATADTAFHALHVEGGWSAVVRAPRVRSEEEWVLHLIERGVLVQPGFFYDFDSEAYLVISLITPPDIFREGVSRMILSTEG